MVTNKASKERRKTQAFKNIESGMTFTEAARISGIPLSSLHGYYRRLCWATSEPVPCFFRQYTNHKSRKPLLKVGGQAALTEKQISDLQNEVNEVDRVGASPTFNQFAEMVQAKAKQNLWRYAKSGKRKGKFRPVGDETINKLWDKAFDHCDKPQKRTKRRIQAASDIRNAVSLAAVAHAILFDADESKVWDYANLHRWCCIFIRVAIACKSHLQYGRLYFCFVDAGCKGGTGKPTLLPFLGL